MSSTAAQRDAVTTPRLQTAFGIGLVAVAGVAGFLISQRAGPPAHTATLYPATYWLLVVGIAVAGATVAFTRIGIVASGSATVGLVLSGQLMGGGIVAYKHWRPWCGMSGPCGGEHQLTDLKRLAIVLAVTGLVGATISLVLLVRLQAFPVRGTGPARSLGLALGVAVIVLVPLALGIDSAENRDVKSLAAYALLYGLPFGIPLAATGWLDRGPAVVAAATVAVSSVLAMLPDGIVNATLPQLGLGLATVAALAVIGFRVRDARESTSTGSGRA